MSANSLDAGIFALIDVVVDGNRSGRSGARLSRTCWARSPAGKMSSDLGALAIQVLWAPCRARGSEWMRLSDILRICFRCALEKRHGAEPRLLRRARTVRRIAC